MPKASKAMASLIAVVVAVTGQTDSKADWPQFGGPGRNFQVPPREQTAERETIQPWQVRLDGGDDCPVVAGDRVIVSQVDFAPDGTDAHRVTCLRQLQGTANGKYAAQLAIPRGDLQYKFTCDTWESTEVRSDGRSISNRRLRLSEDTSVYVAVQAWKAN